MGIASLQRSPCVARRSRTIPTIPTLAWTGHPGPPWGGRLDEAPAQFNEVPLKQLDAAAARNALAKVARKRDGQVVSTRIRIGRLPLGDSVHGFKSRLRNWLHHPFGLSLLDAANRTRGGTLPV